MDPGERKRDIVGSGREGIGLICTRAVIIGPCGQAIAAAGVGGAKDALVPS